MSFEGQTIPLGQLIVHKKGFAFKSKDYLEHGVPVIRVSNFTGNSISPTDLKFVSVDISEQNQEVRLYKNDVVIATVGSWPNNPASVVGRTISVPQWADKALMNQNSVIIRAKSKRMIDQRFIYHQMKSAEFANHVVTKAQGSANQASITLEAIFSFPTFWPNETNRRHIVEILDALDDRISLLRETNTTLESIAQALFKSWFVDFDPVRAKQQGIAPQGMDAATAALFPDSFEESELGEVPKGWRVGTLGDLSDLNPESWTARNHPETIAYIDLANIKDNEIGSIADFPFDEAPSRARRVLRSGDTIVGTVRPGNRSFAFIHEPASNLTASTGFAVLRPKVVDNTEFVYLAATQEVSIEHLAHVADGGAYPAVRPDVVSGLKCVVPASVVMSAFHGVTESLLIQVCANQKQIQTLATLRDTLLPRLISGQLRLPVSA